MRVQSLGWKDCLEKEMATHFSILAWEMPWTTEEHDGLQSMGSQRVRHQPYWIRADGNNFACMLSLPGSLSMRFPRQEY